MYRVHERLRRRRRWGGGRVACLLSSVERLPEGKRVRRLLEQHLHGPLRVDFLGRQLREHGLGPVSACRTAMCTLPLSMRAPESTARPRGRRRRTCRPHRSRPTRSPRRPEPKAVRGRPVPPLPTAPRAGHLVRLDDERHPFPSLALHLVEDRETLEAAPHRTFMAIADVNHDVGRRQEMPPPSREHQLPGTLIT